MGIKVGAQNIENNEYVNNVRKMCRIGINRSSSALKRYDFFYQFSVDYYMERDVVKQLHDVTYSVINKRMQKLSECSVMSAKNNQEEKEKINFIDILLKFTDENGKTMSVNAIREEVDTIMFEVSILFRES